MNFICLTIIIPFLAFLFLLLLNKWMNKKQICFFGCFPILISFILTLKCQYIFLDSHREFYKHIFFNLVHINKFHLDIGIFLDQLSLTMLEVINGVGCLITIFSIWYFKKNTSYYLRYFIYINLFISSMSLLVLSDNLFMLYCGWELVGFCSYSLIGFYNFKSTYINSAIKVFLITKIGDFCLLMGIFILQCIFNTLNIYHLNLYFLNNLMVSKNFLYLHLCLYLIALGACAKSAQFPFHKWLLLAMVGPSTVSALIHSATMITAGVYLIIRLHNFFFYFPDVLRFLSYIGAFTLVYSSFSAIFEKDLKKILAYSTMSQLSYMFLGMSFNIWNIIIFHLVMHSFFKSLLFLSSGSLIYYNKNKQNIFKMSFLKSTNFYLSVIAFFIGGLSLTSFPLLSSSFYTKGMILWKIFLKDQIFLFSLGILGAFFTILYFFRIIFILFFKKLKYLKNFYILDLFKIKTLYYGPLIILMFLSTFFGIFLINPIYKEENLFFEFHDVKKIFFEFFMSILFIVSFYLSYVIFFKKQQFFINYLQSKKNFLIVFVDLLNLFYKIFITNVYMFLLFLFNKINIFYIDYKQNFFLIFLKHFKKINENYIIVEKKSLNVYILLFFLTFIVFLLDIFIII